AGYAHDFTGTDSGALVQVQAPIPIWDRKQGLIREAEARYVGSLATQGDTANRLARESAAAFARYLARREQVARLEAESLPRLRASDEFLREGYRARSAEVTFADVLQAEQALNAARLNLADARRELWMAVADLQGLMQLDLGEACPALEGRVEDEEAR